MTSDPRLHISGLTRRFPDAPHPVLDRLDFAVNGGEIVAVLGRSGSGKSTLFNLIAGIDAADAGSVSVGGTDLTRLSERDRTLFRRRRIGFVYQFFNLIPTLTVEENAALPLELNGDRSRGEVRRLLAAVGLADRADDFPDRLSGGEQQRVAIARALVHHPDLILADEPTGNLDAESGERAIQLLTDLTRERGASLLIATHSLAVSRLADRVLTLEAGRLTERTGALAW